MSGTNPFRRKNLTEGNPTDAAPKAANNHLAGGAEVRIPPIDTDIPRQPKTKTGKTVRIISPHSATSDEEDGVLRRFPTPSRTAASSSPRKVSSPGNSDDESLEDPFSAGSEAGSASTEDDNSREDTVNSTGRAQSESSLSTGMPTNPFKRTLPSLSTNSQLSQNINTSLPNTHRLQRTEKSVPRAHYDVDDFKRLLLTGERSNPEASAAAAPPVSSQTHNNVGDSSSNTDASSISRQSIFEPTTGPIQESAGTSQGGSPSADEPQQPVDIQSPTSQKTKPLAPRHRHGKLMQENAPRTVSFEDPSLSFSAMSSTGSPSSSILKGLEPSGDTDKPLPPLPRPSNVQSSEEDFSVQGESRHVSTNKEKAQSPQKSKPPTPPLSRRHSQLKPKGFSSSERSAPISEEGSPESTLSSQVPYSSATNAPPPPPPPRRSGGPTRVNSSSSVSTSSSIPPSNSFTSADSVVADSPKARPPAPPNRSPTVSSGKRQQIQPSGSPDVAPPPPPRRRGSSQSSYNPSRLSGEYRSAATERFRSDSGASSVSQLQLTSTTPTPSSTGSKNVMADLSALQKEVDELRGKFRE